MTDIDAAFVEQIIDVPERQRKANIQHHRQAYELGLVLKYLNEAGLVIPKRYATALPGSSEVILTRPTAFLRNFRQGMKTFTHLS